MKAGIIIFPGINREHDMAIALEASLGAPPKMLWHKDTAQAGLDLVVIPVASASATTWAAAPWPRGPQSCAPSIWLGFPPRPSGRVKGQD